MKKQTLGLIVTTRDFFPSHLAVEAKIAAQKKLAQMGYEVVTVTDKETKFGAIVTYEEAKTCANLFKKHAEEISGIVVVLPNFGEETGVAEAIDQAKLSVPVLIMACNDDSNALDLANRRDAFCGKLSVCNNLHQRGIKFTTTTYHTCKIESEQFTKDLEHFAAVCRVVSGLKGARIAAIGTRPNAFNTVRCSEKLLQKMGVSVCTTPMTKVIATANSFAENSEEVKQKTKEIEAYGNIPSDIDKEKIVRQAKLCLALEKMVDEQNCQASAIECWDSIQNEYGCATCLSMSMMGEKGKPSACELDITGALTMYAMYLAAQTPSAYLDWNNNVDDEKDMCINLHCSNFPKSFFAKDNIEISNLDVLATTINPNLCFGACKAQVAEGPFTFAKLTTDDCNGRIKMYVGTGEFGSETVSTKGGVALCKIDKLQELMQYLCKNGFEHHVAMCRGTIATVLEEAFGNYLGVDVYHHQ